MSKLVFQFRATRMQLWHVEAQLQEFLPIAASGRTKAEAIRRVVIQIEHSDWFRYLKRGGAKFAVKGAGANRLWKP